MTRMQEVPISDETAITTLIHRWAEAVHTGDLAAVLTDHSPDIVMFDVPPPDDGVRGLAAYREPARDLRFPVSGGTRARPRDPCRGRSSTGSPAR
jgi:ketosteroid isomerase-like protein